MIKRIIAILISILVIVSLLGTIALRADFGDFGGDADYGGDYGGGDDYSYDYGDSDSSDSSDSFDWIATCIGFGNTTLGYVEIVIIVIVLIVFANIKSKKNKNGKRAVNAGATPTDRNVLTPISAYREIDPGFNEAAFKEKLSNLYVQMQNCWTERDIEPLRPYFTDALFTQFERQVETMKKSGRINYVERIAVLDVDVLGYKQSETEDIITARIKTRIVDYSINEKTGDLISGDRNAEKFMTYEWDLSRTKGMKTTSQNGDIHTIQCPHCGAEVDINSSARCEYCDSVIESKEYTWAIRAIRGISQQTL